MKGTRDAEREKKEMKMHERETCWKTERQIKKTSKLYIYKRETYLAYEKKRSTRKKNHERNGKKKHTHTIQQL